MIRALALCALCSPAIAADTATFCGSLGRASIARDGFGYVVTVRNPLCPGNGWMDYLDVIQLSAPGMAVTVQVWSEPGLTPDAIRVIPPAGWMSDPAELVIEEYDTGVIRIVREGLS